MRGRVTAMVAGKATAGCLALLMVSATLDPAAAAAAEVPADHRVYMVADSVGLGSAGAIQRALPEYQVTLDGTPALFVEQLESKFVRTRMATSPSVFGDVAVVAAGYNYPYWDPGRFDRSIDSMIATLEATGAKHIIWVTLREVKPEYVTASAWRGAQPYYWYFPTVNAHLRAAVARHPNLSLADWAAVADRPGLTYDAIHLNPVGAALYSETIADTATVWPATKLRFDVAGRSPPHGAGRSRTTGTSRR